LCGDDSPHVVIVARGELENAGAQTGSSAVFARPFGPQELLYDSA
jgi:hypothetical protein